jgi:hypothetical protein
VRQDIPTQFTHSLIALIDGGSIVAVVVGVAKAFEWFDGMVSDAGRQALSNQLNNAPSEERIDSWAMVFPRLIDRIFGDRALSWRFFARSTVASAMAVLIISLIATRVGYAKLPIGARAQMPWYALYIPVLRWSLLLAIMTNIIPDYCALLVSRTFVRLMAKRPKPGFIVLLMIMDTIVTCSIGLVSVSLAILVITDLALTVAGWNMHGHGFAHGIFGNLALVNWIRLIKNVLLLKWLLGSQGAVFTSTLDFINNFLRILFFSGSFTSVWVWLYVVSILIIKLLHKLRGFWVKIMPFLDIEKRPMIAIGRVAGLLAGAGYAVILSFLWIGRHWH